MTAGERELLRLYALALALIPDADAAGDIFMDARSEADLRRRALAWRRAHGLSVSGGDEPAPALDGEQQAHALHLVRRGRRRRVARRLVGAFLACVVVLGLLYIVRTQSESVGSDLLAGPIPIRRIGGTRIPAGAACGDGNTQLSRGTKLPEYRLQIAVPYDPAGTDPVVALAGLAPPPLPNRPASITLTINGDIARPDSNGCYLLAVGLELPRRLRGQQVQFAVTVKPASAVGGMMWTTRAILVP